MREKGYIVFMKLACGTWAEYTSLKRPVEREMAESLAEHLRRNRTSSMVVEMPSGEIVQEVRT